MKSKIGPSKVPGKKAGPNGSFPVGDPKHARLAIGGATRSFNAGNISASTEAKVKSAARAELAKAPTAAASAKPVSTAPAAKTAPAAPKKANTGKTAPAAPKAVPFKHPPRAFPMDAEHAGNAEKRSK